MSRRNEDPAPEAAARQAKPILSELIDDIRRAAENESADKNRKHLLEMLVVGYHSSLLHAADLDCTESEADDLRRRMRVPRREGATIP